METNEGITSVEGRAIVLLGVLAKTCLLWLPSASACVAVPVPCYVFATTAATAADFFRQLLSEHWMLVM